MEKRMIIGIAVVVAILIAGAIYVVFFNGGAVIQQQKVEQENTIDDAVYNTEAIQGAIIPPNAKKIDVQSLANLPEDSMSGEVSKDEIEGITGMRFPLTDTSIVGPKVSTFNMSRNLRFEKVLLVIHQSYDINDRMLFWAQDVDIQPYDTFGIGVNDKHVFEKFGDFYVFRNSKGNITFVGYKIVSYEKEDRIQSFRNVPFANLSGQISLKEAVEKFTFPHLIRVGRDDPDKKVREQILAFNFTEADKRGWSVANRGVIKQMLSVCNGTIHEARNVQVAPGDYLDEITQFQTSPAFLMTTIKVGAANQLVYVLFFFDDKDRLVAVGWTDELPSVSAATSGPGEQGKGVTNYSPPATTSVQSSPVSSPGSSYSPGRPKI